MSHARAQQANAPLTPEGRRRMVDCVPVRCWTFEATAQRFQVDAKTVRKWRDRFLSEGEAGLRDRSRGTRVPATGICIQRSTIAAASSTPRSTQTKPPRPQQSSGPEQQSGTPRSESTVNGSTPSLFDTGSAFAYGCEVVTRTGESWVSWQFWSTGVQACRASCSPHPQRLVISMTCSTATAKASSPGRKTDP